MPVNEEIEVLKVGDRVWSRGFEVTITKEAYTYHGAEFVEAVRDDGTPDVFYSPAQRAIENAESKACFKESQAGFQRLHNITKCKTGRVSCNEKHNE